MLLPPGWVFKAREQFSQVGKLIPEAAEAVILTLHPWEVTEGMNLTQGPSIPGLQGKEEGQIQWCGSSSLSLQG